MPGTLNPQPMSYGTCDDINVVITQDGCITPERGRIEYIAGIRTTATLVDPSNPVEWQSLIDQGLAFRIKGAGDKAKGAPVTAEGVGSQETRTVGRNQTLNFVFDDFEANIPELNDLNRSTNYRLYYVTERNVFDTGVAANFDCDVNIQRSTGTLNRGEILVTWSSPDLALNYPRPLAIFPL